MSEADPMKDEHKKALAGTFVSCTGTTITIECDDHDTKDIAVNILTEALDAEGEIERLQEALKDAVGMIEALAVGHGGMTPNGRAEVARLKSIAHEQEVKP